MQHLSIELTADGSKTIFNHLVGENYHSKHGALQEASHVFIESGLNYFKQKNNASSISVLEVGFGTGLNFLLSADHCLKHNTVLNYTGIEAFPVSPDLIKEMNYENYLDDHFLFNSFIDHYSSDHIQYKNISLEIIHTEILNYQTGSLFDIIYFDAFAPVHHPEMWTHEVIEHCCSFLKDKGIFVTYSVTGNLKRSLKQLGFEIERPQGAAGKREMMRATKII
jgi:tRNA U34 5-methylaminomethyl-2-thiouridine-forming methyltransferase MnmC